MRYLLNFVYCLVLFAASPWLVYASVRYGKYRDGLGQKLLGLVPDLPSLDEASARRFWFHAVSVGEVNLLQGLLQRLKEQPCIEIVISTTTKTGYKLATDKYPEAIVFYCPLDFSWAVNAAFKRIKPSLLILVELELWPNLLMEAARRDVPVAIVNGRLSDRSTRGYRRLGGLMRSWMSSVQLVTAQSEECAERFVQLGVSPQNVHHVGSMKFDGARTDRDNSRTRHLAQLFQLQSHHVVFLAGSTQPNEDRMVVRVFRNLAARYPEFRLILVPRHPERVGETVTQLDEAGLDWVRRSAISEKATSDARVLLVDTIGELGGWWGCADIGYVGGSIGKRGGQNMIEPAAYRVATCFGPDTRNFRDVVEMLLKADAAEVVRDESTLTDFVVRCLEDTSYRREMGSKAHDVVVSQRGSTAKTVAYLMDCGQPGHVGFAPHPPLSLGKSTTSPQPSQMLPSKRRGA